MLSSVNTRTAAPPTRRRKYTSGSYQGRERRARFFIHIALFVYSMILIIPTIVVISSSLSDENDIDLNGYALIPRKFSLAAYHFLLQDPSTIINAYGVTIFVTLVGTFFTVLLNALFAYALSRRSFRLRRPLAIYIFVTTLFSGGLISSYILMTNYLHLQDTLTVLILPGIMSIWYIFLLRSYFGSLPQELIDAAKIDGASEWRIFFQLILPLSKPALATVALFAALGYWNDWFGALLYISDPHLYPLQYLLYQIQGSLDYLTSATNIASTGIQVQVPAETVRMAMVVITTGPIVLAFLPLQKYFVRGIMLGGLKGD